jgi:DNA polymerase-1
VVDFYTAKSWNNGFKRMFPGVPDYWKRVCSDSKEKGYTETLSGRRYYLTEWNSHKWQTESSAINFPIQGFGGDMKYLAISEVFDKVPEAVYGLDVHDANFYFMPEGPEGREIHLEVFNVLQNLDYEEAWDCEIPIPLLWDGKNGPSWSELEILEK